MAIERILESPIKQATSDAKEMSAISGEKTVVTISRDGIKVIPKSEDTAKEKLSPYSPSALSSRLEELAQINEELALRNGTRASVRIIKPDEENGVRGGMAVILDENPNPDPYIGYDDDEDGDLTPDSDEFEYL